MEEDLEILVHVSLYFSIASIAISFSPSFPLQNTWLLNTMNYFIVKHLRRDKWWFEC